jgi:Fic family protein
MQGNGRTARALSYFVLCQMMDHWFSGKTIPERIRATRDEYCTLLTDTDATFDGNEDANLDKLVAYLNRLLSEQLAEA